MSHMIFLAFAPIFFVMALGYFAGKRRIIDNHHVGELNELVMDFAVPASLFMATASSPRSEMMKQGLLVAIVGTVMLALYLVWYLIQRRVSKASRGDAAVQALTVAQPNFAGVGLPIFSAILGSTATVHVAVALAAGSVLLSPLTLLLLELPSTEGQINAKASATPMHRALRRALTKPIVLAPVLGTLVSFSGLRLDSVSGASLQLIAQTAGGVALFLTGLILSAQPFRLDWKVASATGTANVIKPLLAVAVIRVFQAPPETAKACILLMAMPSGFFGILFGENYRLDSAQVGSIVTASTILSIVTLAIVIAVLIPH
jgi:malonate transporter